MWSANANEALHCVVAVLCFDEPAFLLTECLPYLVKPTGVPGKGGIIETPLAQVKLGNLIRSGLSCKSPITLAG